MVWCNNSKCVEAIPVGHREIHGGDRTCLVRLIGDESSPNASLT